MIIPAYNYLLLKRLEKETATVSEVDIENTHQRYEVVGIHPYLNQAGHYEYGVFVKSSYRVGQIVYVQKHSDADSTKELINQGLALVMVSRVMAVEE